MAVFYCAKPVAFGYVGHGLGELGILVAFGPLPVLGSYWVQSGSFSWSAVLASVPAGLLTVSVLYNHHFTHAAADAAMGKHSPVVVLGERRARKLSPAILALAYATLIANVVFGIFPWPALIALITAPIIMWSYAKLPKPSGCAASLAFLFNVVKTNIATGALVIGALLIAKILSLPFVRGG